MLGTIVADPLFAVELMDFELLKLNDGELKFAVADVLVAADATFALK